MKQIKLMQGDNMKSLDLLPDNSIDSVVTDGPYGLSFMNKKWDYDVPSVEFWKECLRVLKPGGHILSFGGTRTYHRMVVNMEDAGFEIRDQIMWIYGSGFPKSHNIGKSFDKKQGNEREPYERPDFVAKSNKTEQRDSQCISGEKGKYTKGSSQYEGWGTALKPANEPICLARKPLSEKTIVDNVIKWGTGGINVDGCRIGTEGGTMKVDINKDSDTMFEGGRHNSGKVQELNEGRFPANILFDETAAEMLDEQSGVSKSVGPLKYDFDDAPNQDNSTKLTKNIKSGVHFSDKGGASRFFYIAKVGKKERNLGLDNFEDKIIEGRDEGQDARSVAFKKRPTPMKNTHPTLKPINLMTYLCRLITPPGGIVLDPFMGSGSTGISACLEGFRFIGMELDEEYFKIAEARVNNFEEYRKLLKK